MMRKLIGSLLLIAVLASGQSLAPVSGDTLSGGSAEIPKAIAGSVAVFAFSHDAGDKVRPWVEAFARDHIKVWSVINVEGAPFFVKGMIRASLKKDVPQDQWPHTVLVSKASKEWKQALKVADDKLPVVVALDDAGAVVFAQAGLYSVEAYTAVKSRLR
jgi:predicted transcriptional regulator